MKDKSFSPTQKLTLSAMLLALSLLATYLAKMVPMGSFYYLRFSFTPSLIVYTSLALGPLYGALIGGLADLIPAFTYSQGDYNFLITLVYVLLGVLPWALEKVTRHFRSALKKPYAFYGSLLVILAILATIFYATDWLDSSFGAAAVWAKPTILAVIFVLDIALAVALYFTNRYYQKSLLEHPEVPSPNEIAIIALIDEVVVMDLLKALAFYVFYNWISNHSFPLSFGLVFSMLLLGSPLNILIVVFTDSWLLLFTKTFVHAYGWLSQDKEKEGGVAPMTNDEKTPDENESENEKDESREKRAKVGWLIFFGVCLLLMVVCLILIYHFR